MYASIHLDNEAHGRASGGKDSRARKRERENERERQGIFKGKVRFSPHFHLIRQVLGYDSNIQRCEKYHTKLHFSVQLNFNIASVKVVAD